MPLCKHSICGLTCGIGKLEHVLCTLQIMGGKVLRLAKLNLVDLSASWVHMSSCLLARMCIGVVSACLGKAYLILS